MNDVAKVETMRYADEYQYYEDSPGAGGQGKTAAGVYPIEQHEVDDSNYNTGAYRSNAPLRSAGLDDAHYEVDLNEDVKY